MASRIKKGPLPVKEALDLMMCVTDVVACIHRKGILHRDIKPSNIGFAKDGTAKLLDFGLAKLVLGIAGRPDAEVPFQLTVDQGRQDELSLTTRGNNRRVVGTPLYLSPEALAGEEPDYSFDLWSLSVVLFEVITGANPFRGATVHHSLENIIWGRCAKPAELLPSCPCEVVDYLDDALSPDRRRRPPNASAMLETLDGLRSSLS